jgi:phosphoribosylformylglycinamidine cyclo-ligase
MSDSKLVHVDYDTLDRAKNRFIEAAKSTVRFAERFGYIPEQGFGSSANLFTLKISPQLQSQLSISLVPEGLGTADDARPEDLSSEELREFWHNIGIKTVAVMTNDAASSGLQSILIGLYLPSSTPELVFTEEFMEGFLRGFTAGCKEVGCVYLSGETPQLKTKMVPGKLDIAGAVFGLYPAGTPLIGEQGPLSAGDRIVLVESSGPHENGFTSLRALAEQLPQGYRTDVSGAGEFWRVCNQPSRLYTPLVRAVLEAGVPVSNIENITGHGWLKLMRPSAPFRYVIERNVPLLPIFEFVREKLELSYHKLFTVFNCGAGMAIYVKDRDAAKRVVEIAQQKGLSAVDAGYLEASSSREVRIEPYGVTLSGNDFALSK